MKKSGKELELISKIEKLTSKKLELLNELKRSVKNESKVYHLFQDPASKLGPPRYFLYENATNRQVLYGSIARIKSFMNLRNVKIDDVFVDAKIKF
jgi:hypothetical protein